MAMPLSAAAPWTMSTKQLIGLFVSIKLCFLPSKLESYIHGTWLYIDTGIRLAKAGFAIYGIDYEGHGKSAGLAGLVNKFDDIVDDCTAHFTNICG